MLVALFALAAAGAGCGSNDGSDAAPEEASEAQKVLGGVSLDGLKSGRIDLALGITSGGKEGSSLDLRVSGPFRRTGGVLPIADLEITAKGVVDGEPIDFEGGLTLLPKRGFLDYEGVKYEIDPYNFNIAKGAFLPSTPIPGSKRQTYALTGCLEAAADLDLAEFGENLSDKPGANFDGVRTTEISGELDAPAVLDALVKLAKSSDCKAQLAAAGRSPEEVEGLGDDLRGSVKSTHLEASVGDDGIPRRIAGELTADPSGGGSEEVEVDFEFGLGAVNEAPEIKLPSNAKPIFAWLQRLGLSSFESAFLFSEAEALGRVLELVTADLLPSGAV